MIKKAWQKFTLNQQMGNIGSEVARALGCLEKGDKENMEKSAFRALELIDFTIEDKRWQKNNAEIFKLREAVCDMFFGKDAFRNKPEYFRNYFLPFALNINR